MGTAIGQSHGEIARFAHGANYIRHQFRVCKGVRARREARIRRRYGSDGTRTRDPPARPAAYERREAVAREIVFFEDAGIATSRDDIELIAERAAVAGAETILLNNEVR